MIDTPTTPAKTPVLTNYDQEEHLPQVPKDPNWLDRLRQIQPSTVAVSAAVPSSIGAVLSIWVNGTLAGAHPTLFHLIAWYYWYVGPSFLTIGIVFGLRSPSRFVRFLTVHTPVMLLLGISAGRILGFFHPLAEWGKWAYGMVTLALGLPYLLSRVVKWLRDRGD